MRTAGALIRAPTTRTTRASGWTAVRIITAARAASTAAEKVTTTQVVIKVYRETITQLSIRTIGHRPEIETTTRHMDSHGSAPRRNHPTITITENQHHPYARQNPLILPAQANSSPALQPSKPAGPYTKATAVTLTASPTCSVVAALAPLPGLLIAAEQAPWTRTTCTPSAPRLIVSRVPERSASRKSGPRSENSSRRSSSSGPKTSAWKSPSA